MCTLVEQWAAMQVSLIESCHAAADVWLLMLHVCLQDGHCQPALCAQGASLPSQTRVWSEKAFQAATRLPLSTALRGECLELWGA